jgi:hypothetical protein
MTIPATGSGPTVLALTREELIRALRKRHPRISDEGLGKLLDQRLARGAIDVVRQQTGEIDVRLTGAMRRH